MEYSTKNRKILYISPLPPPCGGIASWTKRIMDKGLPRNHKVFLVDTRAHRKRQFFGDSSFSFKNDQLSVSEIYRTIRILTALVYRIIRHYPDLVHLNCSLSPVGIFRDLLCVYITRLCRIPVVCHFHGSIPETLGERYVELSLRLLNHLICLSKINIAMNQPSLDYLLKIVEDKRCAQLPNFVPDNVFEHKILEYNDQSEQRIRILFVGGLALAKGFSEIVEIARLFPSVKFDLVGSQSSNIEGLLKSLPHNINLCGEKSNSMVIKEMCASDLFFFPSHSEGFPNAILEAMAVGMPVISTRVGAIPEMIEHSKGGYVFDQGDIQGFAKAIHALIADPKLRMQMGRYNRKKCKTEYTYSVVIGQLTRLYSKVINS